MRVSTVRGGQGDLAPELTDQLGPSHSSAVVLFRSVLAAAAVFVTFAVPPPIDPVPAFEAWASQQGTPVEAPACHVGEGDITCYGIADGQILGARARLRPDGTAPMFVPIATTSLTTPTAGAGDVQACRAVSDGFGDFAIESRQWVSEDATTINVAPLDWWSARGDLEEVVLAAVSLPADAEISGLLLDLSNAVADDLSEEYDDPDQTVFPTAVYEAVVELNRLSRRLEEHCEALGIEIDAFHPLSATGGGGSGT